MIYITCILITRERKMQVNGWITEETRTARFSDKRLEKRFMNLLDSLAKAPNKSIPEACKTWEETIAAYRFFNHEEISEYTAPH
jgi:hypothetical protein